MFPFLGGEEKGKPAKRAIMYDERSKASNWYILRLSGRKKPWRVLEGTRDRQTGEVQRSGRPRFFKTRVAAEQAILKMYEADKKAKEEKCGPFSEGSSSPAQQELAKARAKMIRKWFPNTIAIQEQIEQTGRTPEHDQTLRKALAIDLARLKCPIDPEITSTVPLDLEFTAALEKAWSSANPLDPIDEEIILNWAALYSEDLPSVYADKICKKTGSKISDDAIKRRIYRMGLRVAEEFQKPKPKPQ